MYEGIIEIKYFFINFLYKFLFFMLYNTVFLYEIILKTNYFKLLIFYGKTVRHLNFLIIFKFNLIYNTIQNIKIKLLKFKN